MLLCRGQQLFRPYLATPPHSFRPTSQQIVVSDYYRNRVKELRCEILLALFLSKENVEDDHVEVLGDGHTFVALIDVVFQDGTKTTCTGTIIHDNVVITCARCFVHETDKKILPELTACFVVIGTRKMYEAGYEQYLPIEKILTHPKFHSTTADLSLVFTFAGMTSDKPGKIVKIAGEKMINPVDSNFTIFSWGYQKPDEDEDKSVEYRKIVSDSQCDDDSSPDAEVHVTAGLEKKRSRLDSLYRASNGLSWNAKHLENSRKGRTTEKFRENAPVYKFPVLQDSVKKGKEKLQEQPLMWQPRASTTSTAKKLSWYLSEEKTEEEDITDLNLPPESQKDSHPPLYSPSQHFQPYEMQGKKISYGNRGTTRGIMRPTMTRRTRHTINRSWRRAMGTTENKLSVLTFGVLNNANCKKIVEKALAPRYLYGPLEVACFTSDEHSLTDCDLGAPVIRHSELFAVILGSIDSEGDHVGIGLKMSCYCSWISANLPGGDKLTCCKNCCDVKHTEVPVHNSDAKRHHQLKNDES